VAATEDRHDVAREPAELRAGGGTPGTARGNATTAAVLLVVATAASLLSGPFLSPVTGSSSLTNAAGDHARVAVGVLLGFLAAFAAPGIALALYPVLRRFGEGLSLGAVAFRVVEGVFYSLGMVTLLSLTTLSQEFVDAGTPGDQHDRTLGRTMLAQYHWLVDVGLLLAFSVGGLMYYLVLYRSRLVPAWLSAWGIAGVVLLAVAAVLIVCGVIGPLSTGQVVLAVPIGVQELVLAGWLLVKGFSPSALEGRRS